MIPNHILDNLLPNERVAVLSNRGILRFIVHQAADPASVIQINAAEDGSEVLATHLDKESILELVASRERDVGGEG